MQERDYDVKDLTKDELDLLSKALTVPRRHFLCYGRHTHKLIKLNLVDDENQLTMDGRSMAKAWMQYRSEEEHSES